MERRPSSPKLLVAIVTMAYPLVVYFGFGRFSPVWLALLLAGLLAARAWIARDPVWLAAAAGATLLALASRDESWVPLKLYPVAVSTVLLCVFAFSLVRPPTIVERIARLTEPALSAAGVAYTRKVTQVWCAFFVFNASVALLTALWGSDELWLLYNGLLSYVLTGALFGAEWLVRQRMRAREARHG